MIEQLRDHLRLNAAFNGCPALLAVTGASGAGKTTILATLREHIDARLLPLIAFDSLGVPTEDEMTRCWDAPRGWQKMMTYHWVHTARQIYRMRPLVILEGQFDPQYVIAACAAHRMKNSVVLLDIDDQTRAARLAKRRQPELATRDMSTWAAHLMENTRSLGGVVVDGSGTPEAVANEVATIAFQLVTTAQ
ncbi:MAG: AAA family ATPase [Myxococcota bacterium]|nr:AAA family ATPase [Myxococcota bacterium]